MMIVMRKYKLFQEILISVVSNLLLALILILPTWLILEGVPIMFDIYFKSELSTDIIIGVLGLFLFLYFSLFWSMLIASIIYQFTVSVLYYLFSGKHFIVMSFVFATMIPFLIMMIAGNISLQSILIDYSPTIIIALILYVMIFIKNKDLFIIKFENRVLTIENLD
jgi:hypothetical protein